MTPWDAVSTRTITIGSVAVNAVGLLMVMFLDMDFKDVGPLLGIAALVSSGYVLTEVRDAGAGTVLPIAGVILGLTAFLGILGWF